MSRTRKVVLLAMALASWIPRSEAATPVAVGTVGTITVPVASNALSFGADNVRVTVSAPAGLGFQVLGTSQLGPLSVSPGTTAVFVINYEIGTSAVDGTYDLQIHPIFDGVDTYVSGGGSLDTSVLLPTKRLPVLDGRAA